MSLTRRQIGAAWTYGVFSGATTIPLPARTIQRGSLVKAVFRYETANVNLTVTDSAGGVWRVVRHWQSNVSVALAWCWNHPGGSNVVITGTLASSQSYRNAFGWEESGGDVCDPAMLETLVRTSGTGAFGLQHWVSSDPLADTVHASGPFSTSAASVQGSGQSLIGKNGLILVSGISGLNVSRRFARHSGLTGTSVANLSMAFRAPEAEYVALAKRRIWVPVAGGGGGGGSAGNQQEVTTAGEVSGASLTSNVQGTAILAVVESQSVGTLAATGQVGELIAGADTLGSTRSAQSVQGEALAPAEQSGASTDRISAALEVAVTVESQVGQASATVSRTEALVANDQASTGGLVSANSSEVAAGVDQQNAASAQTGNQTETGAPLDGSTTGTALSKSQPETASVAEVLSMAMVTTLFLVESITVDDSPAGLLASTRGLAEAGSPAETSGILLAQFQDQEEIAFITDDQLAALMSQGWVLEQVSPLEASAGSPSGQGVPIGVTEILAPQEQAEVLTYATSVDRYQVGAAGAKYLVVRPASPYHVIAKGNIYTVKRK